MHFYALALILFSFFPATANEKTTKLSNYSGKARYLNFDAETYSKKLNSRKKKHRAKLGKALNYVLDYDFDVHEHASELKAFSQDEEGGFYSSEVEYATTYSSPNRSAKSKKRVLISAKPQHATGVQKTLVIPVGDPSASGGSKLYTNAFLNQIYFSKVNPSLNTYYKEVSSERVSFEGEFTQLFVVDGLCDGGDIFTNGGAEFLMDTVDKSIDLSKYDRVSFVFPDDDNCLGGALGVGSLGNISYIKKKNNKKVRVSFNFNISAGADINNHAYFLKVIAHEFGHNFGLQHDNANACGEGIFEGECASLEYGGVHSIMGFSPNLAHLNAIHQTDLQWLTGSQVDVIEDFSIDSEFTLVPLAADDDSSLKTVKIRRDDGSYYVIEYRKPIGMETIAYAQETLDYDGIQIYVNNDSFVSDSVLLRKDFKVFDSQDSYEALEIYKEASFGVNDEFYDSESDIRIIPLSITDTEARFRVIKAPGGVITSSVDSNLYTQEDSYGLNIKGVTRVNLAVILDADPLSNAKIKISIPKASRKFIRVKKRRRKVDLVNNMAIFPVKFAPSKRFNRRLALNADEQYSIPVDLKIVSSVTGQTIKEQTVNILLHR